MACKILVINPGSTSTKLAVFEDTREVLRQNISHSPQDLSMFGGVIDQLAFRAAKIKEFLTQNGLTAKDFDSIAARGGLLKPITSGTYRVNEQMLADLSAETYGSHAANLGALLADQLAKEAGIAAFIVDPVVVDELEPVARVTGRPEIARRSIFHALNQKAVAKRLAQELNRSYDGLNLIVAHLGGGISVGCHKQGKVIDVNNALDGEGPFSPERTGTVQSKQFVELTLAQGWDLEQVSRAIAGKGGLLAHLGTTDVRDVEAMIAAGDEKARLVFEAMIYQIAKAIGAAAIPVCGKVDYIVLTGGIAYSKQLTGKIEEYVRFIAPVIVMPGEDELQALAEGMARVLTGQEQAKEYV